MEIRILATGLRPQAGRRLRECLTELEMQRGELGWFRGELLLLDSPDDAALVASAEYFDLILLGLDGEGYVLAWPSALGARPYQDGHGDQVYKVRWGRNSIYSPPNAYFHQHLNTGHDSAKHIAVYGPRMPLGVHDLENEEGWKGFLSFRDGGTLIEYEDEDPQVRSEFAAELAEKGIPFQMPAVTYR